MAFQSDSSAERFMQSVELETAACPLGCPPGEEHVLTGRDLLHDLPGRFAVVRCASCGLMRTSPRPTPASMGAYYPADYGPYRGTLVPAGAGVGAATMKSRLIAVAKRFFDTKAHALPPLAPGRMLEIGCASGSFLKEMAQKGWNVEGIEFSPEAASAARKLGYSVETGAVESVEKPHESFDLIVGWMVLEHLHEPVLGLKKLASWAKPGACLAISVPNAGSLEARVFGERWYALQLPTHLFHYDEATIKKVLEESGWEMESIHHHRSVANLIASAGYWMRDRLSGRIGNALIGYPERAGRLGAALFFIPAMILSWFGQTGRMTVWARRKS